MKSITIIMIALLLTAWTDKPPMKKKADPTQQQRQAQGQEQGQTQTSNNVSDAAASSSAEQSSSQSINSNYEAQAPDVILIPNNNTENCLRVFGLSFSNQSGGGGLGVPWRSRKCDFEAAADDAFAQGQMQLGWYWKCRNKNLYREFGSPSKCHQTMIGLLGPVEVPQTTPSDPLVTVNCDVGQHDDKHNRIFEQCQSK